MLGYTLILVASHVDRWNHEDPDSIISKLYETSQISSLEFRDKLVIRRTHSRCAYESSTLNAKSGTSSMGIPVNTPNHPLMAPDIRPICCTADHGFVLRDVYC